MSRVINEYFSYTKYNILTVLFFTTLITGFFVKKSDINIILKSITLIFSFGSTTILFAVTVTNSNRDFYKGNHDLIIISIITIILSLIYIYLYYKVFVGLKDIENENIKKVTFILLIISSFIGLMLAAIFPGIFRFISL